jgi:DNA-binding CsgD family transcriptional regulator/quercetin dioxygenase-like cupin family protein
VSNSADRTLLGELRGTIASSKSQPAPRKGAPANHGADGPGVIVLDRGGRISTANASAAEFLRLGDILHASRCKLRAANPTVGSALQKVIAGALHPAVRDSDARNLALLARPGRTPLVVMAAPITAFPHADIGAVILLHDPEAVVPPTGELLNHVFGLTRAESAVCIALLEGQSLRDIADQRGTSVNTVRTLLYQVFAKMGVRRQADLVRLLAPLSSMESLSVGLVSAIQARLVTFGDARSPANLALGPIHIDAQKTAELEMSIMYSTFAPRGSTSKHFASGHELVYVREGTLDMEISGQERRIARAREIVHVGPGVVHRAFNASDREPLKVIVMHLKEKDAVHRVNVG